MAIRGRLIALAHGADRTPVGLALVELHGVRPWTVIIVTPRILAAFCDLGRIQRSLVPAQPHLDGDRDVDGRNCRLDQRQRQIRIAHQRRTRIATDDLLGRAPHIDVYDVGTLAFGDLRRLGHPAGFTPGKLNHMRTRILAFSRWRDSRMSRTSSPLATISVTVSPAP